MTKPRVYKFVAVGDNHGDMVDVESAEKLFSFCNKFKPDIKIHLGDCYDMRSLRQGATGKDTLESLDKDILMGNWFIENYKPDIFLYGNHEDRIHHIIHTTTNGILKDYCKKLLKEIEAFLKENGCKKIFPYDAEKGVYELGPISFVHGYSCGPRAVEEHAIHYAPRKGATVLGHLHTISQVNARKYRGAVGFCGGHLSRKKDMRYAKNRLNTSKWGTGWIYGYIQGKEWKIWQAHKVGKNFIYSYTDI